MAHLHFILSLRFRLNEYAPCGKIESSGESCDIKKHTKSHFSHEIFSGESRIQEGRLV